MKKILLFIAAIAMIACTPAKKTFTINGSVDAANSVDSVVITDVAKAEKIASVPVLDGKFVFEASAEVPAYVAVSAGKARAYAIVEPGVITMTIGANGEQPTVSGTILNDAMQNYNNSMKVINDSYSANYTALKEKYADNQDSLSVAAKDYFNNVYTPELQALISSTFGANRLNMLGVITFMKSMAEPTVEAIDAYMVENPLAATYEPIVKEKTVLVSQENTAVGKMFTDFTARNIENTEDVQFSSIVGKGKYVLVDFWASWCGPCKREMPYIREVFTAYGKKDLVVLSVNVWDKYDACINGIKELDMPWSHLYASDNKTATDLYGIKGIPQIILFAPDGTIVDRSLRGEEMVAKVKELFKK